MKNSDLVIGLGANGAFTTSESHAAPRNRPGERCTVLAPEGERWFKYQKVEEAFAIGQVAMISALIDNADVDAAQATTTAILHGDGDFTASQFGGSGRDASSAVYPDAWVSIDANGTGIGQTRYIKHNRGSADYLTLDHNWDTALNTSSDYVTYSINYVSLVDTDDVSADSCAIKGVAVSAVTDEQWAWFQIKGFCPTVRFIGSSDAAVRGEPITGSATAGAAKGQNATLAVIDINHAFGIAMHAYAEADAAAVGVAAELDCRYA